MALWLIIALMTGVAIVSALWPFWRRRKDLRSGSDVAVYRDQLDEIERDEAAGRIAKTDAQAARVEVSRRLLAASDLAKAIPDPPDEKAAVSFRRAVAVGAILLLLGAPALYRVLGSPDLSSELAASRTQAAENSRSTAAMVAKVRAYLEQNPKDGRGWEVLAPIYMESGQYDEAVIARRHALEILGPTAARLGDLGEAIVMSADRIVTAEAKALFERAAVFDPEDVMAQFYLGLAAKQDGRRDEADKIWRTLLARAPAGAPWIELVKGSLARIDEKDDSPPRGASDTASAPPEHSGDAIRGMVERLAERLKSDGSDAEGWAKLVRSYTVLGEAEKAAAATRDAGRALAADPNKLQAFENAVKGVAPAVGADNPVGPTEQAVTAAAAVPAGQQTEMIRGMVERLAARLQKDGSDVDGWVQLVRSYSVLGETEKARNAASEARRALSDAPDKQRKFDETIKGLGING